MSNDRLYIRCRCGQAPQMLAKIWGGRIGADTYTWPMAMENLKEFFADHAGCAVEDFSLGFEIESLNPTPPAAASEPPTPPSHPSR